jgi:hypothetical protein
VNVGGQKLNLYAQDYISIRHANRHPNSTDTYCQFNCGINNIHFTNQSDNIKKVTIPYGFNISIHTKIQVDTIGEKEVNVPDYLQIDTPNPMTDDVSKSIIIPYELNIGLTDTEFTIYNANENKNITIPRGTIIPSTFNAD